MLKPSFQPATLFPQLLHFFYLSSSSSLQHKQGREGERVESPRRAKDQKIDPMKAKVMGKYESCKNNASATLSINVGQELVLKTTMTNATFVHGPSLTGLELALHKPNSFTLHCNIPRKDIGFQFMNKVTVMDRIVNFTCTHAHWGHHTAMEGSVAFDPMNKVRIGYGFGSRNWRVKYVYAHGLRTVVEP